MFLTTPTPEELQQFELPELMDMLAKHTTEYIQLFKEKGVTSHTAALREMVINIQMAIDHKKTSETSPPNNNREDTNVSLSQ